MIQLFAATFPSTAGEFKLMIRISDNITSRGGERQAWTGGRGRHGQGGEAGMDRGERQACTVHCTVQTG